jgi:dTDP-4-dehydrorhamnose reductase
LDLTDFAAVERRFLADRPRLIIHCAAMSKTDCQANPAQARRINVEATARLAALAAESDFIFFSTDLVFDGRKGNYVETDAVNPLSVYGETKVAAEAVVTREQPATSWCAPRSTAAPPPAAKRLQRAIPRRLGGRKDHQTFHDEYRSPISATATARAIWELAAHPRGGLWHLAGANVFPACKSANSSPRHPELSGAHRELLTCASTRERPVPPTLLPELRQTPGALHFPPARLDGVVALVAGIFLSGMFHDRILEKRDTARRLADFYKRGLDRLGNRWAGKGSAGTELLDKQHPYAIDLDIFGTGSLFELVNTAQTQAGRTKLAQWLLHGADHGEVAARQMAVAEMRSKLDLREELAMRAGDARAHIDTDALMSWAAQPPNPAGTVERVRRLVSSADHLGSLAVG